MLEHDLGEFSETQWKALIGESSKGSGPFKKHFEELLAKVTPAGVASGLVALATRTDCTEKLSKIRVPVLLVVGDEHKVTPVSDSEAMAKVITGSQLKILSQTGHLSNLENPQKFNDHLTQFFMTARILSPEPGH